MTLYSAAFELLDPRVRNAVIRLGWQSLNPLQESAIPKLLLSQNDAIICAPTSGGKTEAVFLPILSQMLKKSIPSLQAVYVSPLKALINDQYKRLISLTKDLDIPVHRWHGDVDQGQKKRVRYKPRGILLITPESLESNFINFSHCVARMYRHVQFVVIDEIHAVLETERGIHLRSLLSRLFDAIGNRPRCLGLSATLPDAEAAKLFINNQSPDRVVVIEDNSNVKPLKIEVKTVSSTNLSEPTNSNAHPTEPTDSMAQIADDLLQNFRESTNLVFANSRRIVEMLADRLANSETIEECTNVFALHHGSLSASVRQKTEIALKSGGPTTALCTSSLELGIDIGAVATVAQIDPPWSVSSLVQRLGRSGRREGQSRVLKLYVQSSIPQETSSLSDLLFPKMLKSVALINLMLSGWLEPPHSDRVHLSTLIHQILSKIKETGGVRATDLYECLCQRGPFRRVLPSDFKILLKRLAIDSVVDQTVEGEIILGPVGERITISPRFYAAFDTPLEFSVRNGATLIGKLPVTFEIKAGTCLVLNGRRWLIEAVHWRLRTIWVCPTNLPKAPVFQGEGGETHTGVLKEIRRVLRGSEEPPWLDAEGLVHLRAAREAATRAGLTNADILSEAEGTVWFPWIGSRASMTLALWAKLRGIDCSREFLCLKYPELTPADLENHLREFVNSTVAPIDLAALMENKTFDRFDIYVDEILLDKANGTDRLDMPDAVSAAQAFLETIDTLN